MDERHLGYAHEQDDQRTYDNTACGQASGGLGSTTSRLVVASSRRGRHDVLEILTRAQGDHDGDSIPVCNIGYQNSPQ